MSGTVKVIMEPQTFPSGFSKREFVVTVEDGKFPQDVCFECVKERMSILDGVTVGEQVNVAFDIRGREHNGRYFNNLNAWKIERSGGGGGGGAPPAAAYDQAPPQGGAAQGGSPAYSDSENPENDTDPF